MVKPAVAWGKLTAIAVIAASCALGSLAARAQGFGAQLYGTGSNVTITVMPCTAAYSSDLYLFLPGNDPIFVANNHDEGVVANLGSFPLNEELLFGIYVHETETTYYMGPGNRNPDDIVHARAVDEDDDTIVGFEDLWNGGDKDYDDNVFRFHGTAAPEPGTIATLGLGAVSLLRLRRRKA